MSIIYWCSCVCCSDLVRIGNRIRAVTVVRHRVGVRIEYHYCTIGRGVRECSVTVVEQGVAVGGDQGLDLVIDVARIVLKFRQHVARYVDGRRGTVRICNRVGTAAVLRYPRGGDW